MQREDDDKKKFIICINNFEECKWILFS